MNIAEVLNIMGNYYTCIILAYIQYLLEIYKGDKEEEDAAAAAAYPGEVEMGLVMSADSIIDDLELLRRVDGHTRHVLHPLAYRLHMFVLMFLQPGAFAYPVVCDLEFPGLVVLHCRSLKLPTDKARVLSLYERIYIFPGASPLIGRTHLT
jgi:hypothetical protein